MKLEIYRGDIVVRTAMGDTLTGCQHVGVIDTEREPGDAILCVTGPAGDPDSELLARRIKAMFEFCEPFAIEFMEQAAEDRAKRGLGNYIKARASI